MTDKEREEFEAMATKLIEDGKKKMESALNDACEKAFWQYDARTKGYAEWEGHPQSERDAFKDECYMVGKGHYLQPEIDVAQQFCDDLMTAEQRIATLEAQVELLCKDNQRLATTRGFCCCGECEVDENETNDLAMVTCGACGSETATSNEIRINNKMVKLEQTNRVLVEALKMYGKHILGCELNFQEFLMLGG